MEAREANSYNDFTLVSIYKDSVHKVYIYTLDSCLAMFDDGDDQSVLMIDDEDDFEDSRPSKLTTATVVLHDIDFPREYVNMKHPEDYQIQANAINPTFVVVQRQGHARLIFRISWKTGSKFMPMTFIVDTGAVQPVYFSKVAMALMEAHGLLVVDDVDNDVVELHKPDGTVKKVHYKATPSHYEPANLIGLRFIMKFGLVVDGDSFRFNQPFDYF